MSTQSADVLIIGGGITGAGCALELSQDGYSVVLIEKGDFASGTSSKTTKLIHGGLRYLRTGDLRQVRLGLRARSELLRIAPELVRPIRIQIPYRNLAERAYLEAGIVLYEMLAGRDNPLPRHSRESDLLGSLGSLATRPKGFLSFWDAQTDDTALVFSVLFEAEKLGAVLHNYTDILSAAKEPGRVVITLQDHRLERQCEISCGAIVNASGVWTPEVNKLLGLEDTELSVRMSKGVHILSTVTRFPLESGLLIPNEDGRPIFALPWQGRILIGTTDAEYRGDPNRVLVRKKEVEYLLGAVNSTFPGLGLTARNLTGHFAGVRPLVSSRLSRPTAELSRRHAIHYTDRVISATGGKLTTFRSIARDVSRLLKEILGDRKEKRTTGGEETLINRFAGQEFGLTAMLHTGARATQSDADSLARFARKTMVLHLDDLLLRRSHALVLDRSKVLGQLRQTAEVIGSALGWSGSRIHDEIERVQGAPEAIPPENLPEESNPSHERDSASQIEPQNDLT